jgi:sulfofructose kinase
MNPSVLCVGIATQDFVFGVETFPRTAQKHRARDFKAVGGGIAANAAVAIARLGGQAGLAARLGDDAIGRGIVAELMAEGVNCRLVRHFPERTSPVSSILIDQHGERLVVNHADPLIPEASDWLPDALPEGCAAVLGDTRWEAGALALFSTARKIGCPAILDGDRAPENPALLAEASHLVFAAQAARDLTGENAIEKAFEAFPNPARAFLAITDGARGSYYQMPGSEKLLHVPAYPVKAVDTLGAGDVFHGAFALALAEKRPEADALRFAAAAAALKCTRFGGRVGTPNAAEVEAFMKDGRP